VPSKTVLYTDRCKNVKATIEPNRGIVGNCARLDIVVGALLAGELIKFTPTELHCISLIVVRTISPLSVKRQIIAKLEFSI
jgi:hypothetical protein